MSSSPETTQENKIARNSIKQYYIYLQSQGIISYHVYVDAPKIGSRTRGILARSRPWLVAPYLFGIAGPTGDNGTSFPIYECVCVEFDVIDLTGPIYNILILTLI